MSDHNDSREVDASTGIPRRSVLQTIGGLGAAGLAGVGSASASTGGMGQLQMQSPEIGEDPAILVFSATEGFTHGAIPTGNDTIEELATEIGNENDVEFTVEVITGEISTGESDFPTSADELEQYDVVVWNSTTGDVLDEEQQAAFETYIQNGGGYMGIHAAADTEYDWEFYGELVGAYFEDHPPAPDSDFEQFQEAEVHVTDRTHPSTSHLPAVWTRTDEWYNYQSNPRGDVHVLAALDQSTYNDVGFDGSDMGADHPIAWAQYYQGARSFYTGGGHLEENYSNEDFRQHLKGGLTWAAGYVDGGASGTVWDNYTKVPLDTDTKAPANVDTAPDGRVYYVDRAGFGTGLEAQAQVMMIDQNTADNAVSTALDLTVYNNQEDGLLGLVLDSDFQNTGYVYLYYSPPNEQIAGDDQEALEYLNTAGMSDDPHPDGVTQAEAPIEPYNLLARFTVNDDGTIDPESETEILRVHTQRDTCCHTGGDMHWSPDGEQLYLTTGDDTNPFQSSAYAPIDERDGRSEYDAQRSAGNTNDLRGSILRIIPQDDGSYTVPDDNLYAQLGGDNGGNGGNGGNQSSDLPPVVGDSSPLDHDGDGHFEDVDGSGQANYDDVVHLFQNFEADAVRDNVDAYDFNENDQFEYDDIVDLFTSVGSGPAVPEGVRPEIYTMGARNPFRAAVDQETGTLYWGNYGPDAGSWNAERGPPGMVEFNKANEPGFYGWPYFVGPNIPYIDGEFVDDGDGFTFESSGEPFDPENPVNESPNNDGLTDLPTPADTMIYYTGRVSYDQLIGGAPEYAQEYLPDEYPFEALVGEGGGAPMAGPLYRRPDDADPSRSLPDSFDGKFFMMEWNESWIKYASFDENGNITEIDEFLPDTTFNRPMDMTYGQDGALYLVEWGTNPYPQNGNPESSGVYRIDHDESGGNDDDSGDNDDDPGDTGPEEQVSLPFAYDGGGGEIDGTVTIDGTEFVASSPAVTASGNADASGSGADVAVNSFPDQTISGTDNPALYQSEEYGGDLSYEVGIPNGTYNLTFYFSENYHGGDGNGGGEGTRVFDISVEGKQVISGLDIFAEVGHDAALTRTVEGVEVSDGALSISTTTQADNSKFSGILIESAGGDGGDGGAGTASATVPQTGGGVGSEPAFTLAPSGDTYQNRTTSGDTVTSGPDDLSADVFLGYDADNLYVRAEVTDDIHNPVSDPIENMWQGDNVQVAVASDGTYGPEYGFNLDGSTNKYRWIQGGATAGVDAGDATVSRSNSVTTYDLTFPWNTLFPESKSAGDSFPFSILVNERDDTDARQAILESALGAIADTKSADALGTLTLGSGGGDGGDGGDGTDGGDGAIPAGTTIELGGEIDGWIGESPSSVQGTNPTLTLQEGEDYTVTFENLDNAPHDFVLLDSEDTELQGTDLVNSQGETATLEFTASPEMAQYYCSVHPSRMRGDIELV